MKMLCDELSQQGVIFAGPDILPYRTALNGDTGVYKTHSQYYGIVPLGNSMQADSYRHHKNDLDLREEEPLPEEGYIPVEDIFLFGRDVLKLNYIFWSHNFVDKKVPHNTFYDGIDVINKYPTFNE